jgi:hypothetical protein
MPPSHSHQDASGVPTKDPHAPSRPRGRYPLLDRDRWPAAPGVARPEPPKDPEVIPSEAAP